VRILLDTQSWLWLVGAPARLSRKARGVVEDPSNELLLSAASSWEIAIKYSIGKLDLSGDPETVVPDWMVRSAVTALPVSHAHALRVASLPFHHADPFDRILIAQAQIEDVPVLTSDPVFREYEVEVIRA
jgi:PIN domain nuclease of toxin-antitoxin system